MTAPTHDTRSVIGRQVSIVDLPIMREPLPMEIKDLVARLVAFEARSGEPSHIPTTNVLARGGFENV